MINKKTRLKQLRLEAGLSQNRLAREANLDRGTVSSAENGNSINEVTASKLAKALSKVLERRVDIGEF